MPLDAAAYLTPDALIAFVQDNLSRTDGEIQGLMSQVSGNRAKLEQLQTIAADMRNMKGASRDDQSALFKKLRDEAADLGVDIHKEFGKWVAEPNQGAGPDAKAIADALSTHLNGWNKHLSDGKARAEGHLESEAQAIDAIANKMSGGAEITMIKLQSLVQERTRIIQFASNTMSACNRAIDAPVNNIGRSG